MAMCTKAEVKEVFDLGIKPIISEMGHLSKGVDELKARMAHIEAIHEKQIELKAQVMNIEKDLTQCDKERDQLFNLNREMTRDVNTKFNGLRDEVEEKVDEIKEDEKKKLWWAFRILVGAVITIACSVVAWNLTH